MRNLKLGLLILLILMSLAAGLAKVMLMPQEIAFFEAAGLSAGPIVPFGVIQLIGAGLAVAPKTRKYGLASMAVSFLASAGLIFASGNMVFGVISMIPVIIAAVLAFSQWGEKIHSRK